MKNLFKLMMCSILISSLVACFSPQKTNPKKESTTYHKPKELEIIESGYGLSETPYIMYGVKIKNPNQIMVLNIYN